MKAIIGSTSNEPDLPSISLDREAVSILLETNSLMLLIVPAL
jgi:hypothetical protein